MIETELIDWTALASSYDETPAKQEPVKLEIPSDGDRFEIGIERRFLQAFYDYFGAVSLHLEIFSSGYISNVGNLVDGLVDLTHYGENMNVWLSCPAVFVIPEVGIKTIQQQKIEEAGKLDDNLLFSAFLSLSSLKRHVKPDIVFLESADFFDHQKARTGVISWEYDDASDDEGTKASQFISLEEMKCTCHFLERLIKPEDSINFDTVLNRRCWIRNYVSSETHFKKLSFTVHSRTKYLCRKFDDQLKEQRWSNRT